MTIIKLKKDFDHERLKELGYGLVLIEGGYVSADGATIVNILRSPYQRQINQYMPNVEAEHKKNVEQLKNIGAIEE